MPEEELIQQQDKISKINNTQIDLDVVMLMYDSKEYRDNYSKRSVCLRQYYRDEPNATLAESESFEFTLIITGSTTADGNIKNVGIAVPLKYFSNFRRTLGMPLINCESNLTLTRSSTCIIINSTGAGTFAITDTKLYVPPVTLSTQDSAITTIAIRF